MTNNEKNVFAAIKGHFDMFGRAISENELYDNVNMFPADFKSAVKSLLANGKIEKCGNSWLKPFGVTVKTGPVPSAEEIRPKPLKRKNGSVRRKKVCALLFAVIVNAMAFATPVVTDITAKQRFPWNGLVDITVTLFGTEEECKDETLMIPLYATVKTTQAKLSIRTVMANGAVTGEGNLWTRKMIWDASADVGCEKFGEVEMTAGKLVSGGVQLWENGPYWAECNVGALKPEESGYYFWWGDTIGYKRNETNDAWVSVNDGSAFIFDSDNCPGYSHKQWYTDSTGRLAAKYDAATVCLGLPWRTPTSEEFNGITGKCTTKWTTRKGVYGYLVTGKGAYSTKSIFLPATGFASGSNRDRGDSGFYWTSTPNPAGYYGAMYWVGGQGNIGVSENPLGRYGQSVRPVRGFAQ